MDATTTNQLNQRGLTLEIWLIVCFSGVRCLVAPQFGLSVDEAHYVLYGMHPDWSYFDHPPLVGWIHWIFLHTLGKGELWARLPAILLSALTSVVCLAFLKPYLTNPTYSVWALIALNASLGFAALSLMLLPDSLLFILTLLFIITVNRVRIRDEVTDWLLLGLVTGLAGLAKYSAILLPLALVITLIDTGEWRFFLKWKLLLAVAIAFILITPVLVWNIRHGFASFQYQQGRVLRVTELDWRNLLTSYATQFLVFGPLLAPIAGYGLWRLFWYRDFTSRLVLWICIIWFSFFSFAGLGKPTLPHWWGVLYILAIPIGTVLLLQDGTKIAGKLGKIAIVINFCLAIVLHIELAYPFLPMPNDQSIHRDLRGWPRIMATAETILDAAKHPPALIAVPNWSLGSRAMYYAKDPTKIIVIDNRFDQFDLWQPLNPKGRDLLLVLPREFHINPSERYKCTAIGDAGAMEIRLPTHRVDQVAFVWCWGFSGLITTTSAR